ncbi:MAG: PqqD family protein [bacterium]
MLNEKGNINIKQDIVLREEEEGSFLFDPNTGRICFLNETGTNIWRLCDKSKTPDQVISRVCSDYPEIPKEQIVQDCLKFLTDLEKLEFLSIKEESY